MEFIFKSYRIGIEIDFLEFGIGIEFEKFWD